MRRSLGRKRTLLIPGGWTLYVPECKSAEAEEYFRGRYLEEGSVNKKRSGTMSYAKAQQEAEVSVDAVWCRGWKKLMYEGIAHHALDLARKRPDLLREVSKGTFELEGFDAERTQALVLPRRNTGRRSK